MKILLYIDCMQLGGANRVMANLANYFSKKGYEVILVNDILPEKEKQEHEISTTIKRVFLDSGKKLSNSIFIKQFMRIKALRKCVKYEDPNIVLSFMGPPNIRMLVATLGLKTKKIVSVRNDPSREYGIGVAKLLANAFFLLANGIVFQTDEARKYFLKVIQKKSKIILNPVNSVFYQKKAENIGNNIVVIGRLQKQKNPGLVLKSFIKIHNEFPDVSIHYYGDGELKKELLKEADMNGVSDKVFFHGQTANVGDVLVTAKIYVLSSDYEGLPNSLMEAMAVGVPVISTDCPCGGPRVLIENQKQGILTPCGDIESMANAMRFLLSNSLVCAEMSEAERLRAQDFLPEIIFNQWDNYINNI